MTTTKLKRAARARQVTTGERYTEALARVHEGLAMSTKKEVTLPDDIFTAVQSWLEARGFAVMWRANQLHYSNPHDRWRATLIYRADVSEDARFELSFPERLNDGNQRKAYFPSEVDLIIFALDVAFGQPATLADAAKEEVLRLQQHTAEIVASRSLALVEKDRAEAEAQRLRVRLAEFEGKAAPDPWLAAFQQGADLAELRLPLYSTYRFRAGSDLSHSYQRLFVTPLGQSGQGYTRGLSRAETNIKEGGRVPGGLPVRTVLIMVELIGQQPDIEYARRNAVLAWDFAQTQVDIGPLSAIIPPGKTSGVLRLGSDSAGPNESNTLSNLFRIFGKAGVKLPTNASFCVGLTVGHERSSLSADLEVRVTLGLIPEETIEVG